jgi:hypothetical protein
VGCVAGGCLAGREASVCPGEGRGPVEQRGNAPRAGARVGLRFDAAQQGATNGYGVVKEPLASPTRRRPPSRERGRHFALALPLPRWGGAAASPEGREAGSSSVRERRGREPRWGASPRGAPRQRVPPPTRPMYSRLDGSSRALGEFSRPEGQGPPGGQCEGGATPLPIPRGGRGPAPRGGRGSAGGAPPTDHTYSRPDGSSRGEGGGGAGPGRLAPHVRART